MKKPNINFKELYKIYALKYPELSKLQEKQKFVGYLYLTLTLFTVSFFGIFAILPTLTTISTLKKQYADNQLVYENLKVKLENLQSLTNLYSQLGPHITLIDKAIPPTSEIPVVVRKIETLAQNHGLFISGIDTGAIEIFPGKKKDPPIYSYTINMKLAGSADSINTFISDVINFDRIVSIDSITSGRSDESRSEVSITGRVFFYAKP